MPARSKTRTANGHAVAGTVMPLVEVDARLRERDDTIQLLQESIAALQLAADDVGWVRLGAWAAQEFTTEGLKRISATCRVMTAANPMIARGFHLRTAYVHGDGVNISARATGNDDGEQDVNAVVQAFLNDDGNRRALTDASAQARNERALFTDGNLFVSLWTRPVTGNVSARILPWDEITDVICNPQDGDEPWFYKREWAETAHDLGSGLPTVERKTAYYPALSYRPKARVPKVIGGAPVQWDAPVRHVKVNDEPGWRFGLGDAYPALDWARAYKEFLEAWATLVKALSRFAWRMTAKGSARATQAKTKLAAHPARDASTGQAATEVGATAILPPEMLFEAIPKSGATIDSESGRPLAAMVAAALDVPVTMLLGDPGMTGARATAETLDRPTELVMQQRRQVWVEALRDILGHVVASAVRAPEGKLTGRIVRDEMTGQETVELAGDTSPVCDISYPDLDDQSPRDLMAAIAEAAKVGVVPPKLILRWMLMAMGEKRIDEIVDELTDPDTGEFIWPGPPPLTPGQQAAALARSGGDPARAGVGSMTPDGDDEGDAEEDGDPDEVVESDRGVLVPNVLIDMREAISDAKLRAYWVHGKGAAKIRWGSDGDFDRCVRHLGKYVADPKGLCNTYHQDALGAPPGKGH